MVGKVNSLSFLGTTKEELSKCLDLIFSSVYKKERKAYFAYKIVTVEEFGTEFIGVGRYMSVTHVSEIQKTPENYTLIPMPISIDTLSHMLWDFATDKKNAIGPREFGDGTTIDGFEIVSNKYLMVDQLEDLHINYKSIYLGK